MVRDCEQQLGSLLAEDQPTAQSGLPALPYARPAGSAPAPALKCAPNMHATALNSAGKPHLACSANSAPGSCVSI